MNNNNNSNTHSLSCVLVIPLSSLYKLTHFICITIYTVDAGIIPVLQVKKQSQKG